MVQSRYWRWYVRNDQGWSQTTGHERWDGVKQDFPEDMPVLGTMILHSTPLSSEAVALYESLEPDVPF